MRITIRIDGDAEGQLAISVSHSLGGGQNYDYGATSLEGLPTIVACAMDEIVREVQALLALEPHEQTQAEAHRIWLEGQAK